MPEEVHILSESKVVLPVAPGTSREMVALTYAAGAMVPRIVYIDADRDSEAERKRVIAEDLRKARAAVPRTLRLP